MIKVKLAQMEFFLFRVEENNGEGAERKMVEAPGSNACSRPLLDVINGMMHYSVDDLQPTNVEVKWRTKSSFKTIRLNGPFKSNNIY